jgi:hypothetical protein
VISLAGQFDGQSWLPFWVDIGVVVAFSLAIFALAVALRLPAAEARGYVEDLDPMLEDTEAAADEQNLRRSGEV